MQELIRNCQPNLQPAGGLSFREMQLYSQAQSWLAWKALAAHVFPTRRLAGSVTCLCLSLETGFLSHPRPAESAQAHTPGR